MNRSYPSSWAIVKQDLYSILFACVAVVLPLALLVFQLPSFIIFKLAASKYAMMGVPIPEYSTPPLVYYLMGIAFLAFIGLIIRIGIVKKLTRGGVSIEGTVKDIYMGTSLGRSSPCVMAYGYTYEGKQYKKHCIYKGGFSKGQKITVLLNAQRPRQAIVE